MLQLHVHSTLHPTEAERGRPYISTLMPFEDCTVPILDEVVRDIIALQFHTEPLGCGSNVENSTGAFEEEESSEGGSEDDEESRDSEGEEDSEESGGDENGDGNDEDFEEGEDDSGDSDGEQTRRGEFISTLVPPSCSSTTAPTGEAEIEPRVL
ncbi:Hypothetical predicted protein, partial [Olea europaea subsp. europaea]